MTFFFSLFQLSFFVFVEMLKKVINFNPLVSPKKEKKKIDIGKSFIIIPHFKFLPFQDSRKCFKEMTSNSRILRKTVFQND